MQLSFTLLTLLCAFVIGLVAGSFLNSLARRIVHGEPLLQGRPHCTSCNHELRAADLIPVFSWIALHGTCRYCGAKIAIRYPLTELLCGIVYASIVARYGLTFETVELLCFASVLLVLSLTDLDVYLIPNACIVVALVVRVCYLLLAGVLGQLVLPDALLEALANGIIVMIPLFVFVLLTDKLLGRPSLGGGDLKLLFVAGFYFGWQQCLVLVVIACVLGLAFAYLGARRHGSGEQRRMLQKVSFGPAIAAASWAILLFGQQLISWM